MPRKFIIFTEHRDTLDYLTARIRSLLGKPDAVKSIHGGVRRLERRVITEEFTKNRSCQILLATDAAGEGLNLQAAPDGQLRPAVEPNRIEQRFGRIHRIGQEEVCRLWNLVASNTRGRRVRPAADQGRRAAKGQWRQGVRRARRSVHRNLAA
ncbi:helicase domain protein [Mycobacterium kansasii]|uniref:Helicase domain protein n=1 Tax=Mycobacterium kansasii TaxID=1768 RepID=A0A1V3W9W8_MYCKA|nr:helicase domain protein [Mycobacterium kansasii]